MRTHKFYLYELLTVYFVATEAIMKATNMALLDEFRKHSHVFPQEFI